MEVECLRVHQNVSVEQLCKISQPGQQGRRLSTASHTRTSSTSSTSPYLWTPVSPSSGSYGLLPPIGLMPHYHAPTPVAVGTFIPANIAPRAENFAFIPAPETASVYGYNIANPVGLASNPPVYAQASATGPHVARQDSTRAAIQRRQIIVQNLYVGVKEHWLKDLFTKSVGPVQECRIEERGDKKRHALVSFTHADHAQAAVHQFNEKPIEGRKVNVRLTKEVQEGPVIIDGSGVYG
ncbi:MAG: hypothetical protein L6R42_000758 [Xanthoria sp. 1 TBL-2021]|nr:MAG: hypothetical protein L6R42_000758 [Xanthoria sp. 1 TBL-2021]